MYRRSRRGRLVLPVLLALSVAIIAVDVAGAPDGASEAARSAVGAVLAPIQRGITNVTRPVGNFFASVAELARLRDQNRELEAEVAKLKTQIGHARDLVGENAELRAHLGLAGSWLDMERVTAQVIADAPGNYRWAVVIDKGSAEGIRRNMPVVDPAGLVGKVIRVDAHQSTVLLLLDPNAGAAARVEGKSATGAISGNGAERDLSLEFIDKDAGVAPGDRVLTSNFNEGVFPSGIPIGSVSAVRGDQRVGEFDIWVTPAVDFRVLDFVEVLLTTPAPAAGVASP